MNDRLPILLTKVRLPQRRKDVIRRVRLIDSLHQNIHRKLIFVSAPAGYGKSTLLIDFASDVDALVGWYSIGADDSDFIQFAYHLLAAFQEVKPDFGDGLYEVLRSAAGEISPETLAFEFINAIESQIDDFFILILDDYQLVVDNQRIVDFIESILNNLPDRVRIIIGSRSVYGIPTANLYVREDLFALGADDLRFRKDELKLLVQQNYHVNLTDKQAEELAARADGWVVAIMLAVRALEHGGLPKFDGATDQVYSYLAQEVIQRLPDELQDFLMTTSILDHFTEPLCNFMLDTEDSGKYLSEIQDRNLFVTSVETQAGVSYRYHHLFSDFLQNKLSKNNPEKFKNLHSRAAGWYQQGEAWDSAINHKLAAGEREEAAKWIDTVANSYSIAGRRQILSQWYAALSDTPDMRAHAPHFMVDWAKVLIDQSAYAAAEQLLDIAETPFNDDDLDLTVNGLLARGAIRLLQRNYDDAVVLADKALSYIEDGGNFEELEYRRYQIERLNGMAFHYLGRQEESIEFLDAAVAGFRQLASRLEGSEHTRKSHDLAEALSDLGYASLLNGHIGKAQKAFQEALAIRRSIKGNKASIARVRNNVAYLYYLAGHYRKAWREYEQAIDDGRADSNNRILIDILNGRGDLLLDLDDFENAEKEFKEAIRIGEDLTEHVDSLSLAYLGMSKLERKRENFNDAIYWLREAGGQQEKLLDESRYQTELGEIYLHMGQLDLAEEALLNALDDWESITNPREEHARAAFLLSKGLVEKNQMQAAGDWLSRALKWSAILGYDNFLINAGREAPKFLEIAEENWQSKQLGSLVKRVKRFKTGREQLKLAEVPIEVPALHLDVTAFGTGEVRRNGELIPNSVWRSNRSRSLFFYFIEKKRVRKEDVALDFWPEFSPARVNSNFHATLWRVRNALGGNETVLFEGGRYFLHPEISLWYDVEEFKQGVTQANSEGVSSSQKLDLLQRAIKLHTGEFLDSIFMEWADKLRKELQEKYLQALMALATLEMENNRFQDAKVTIEKALEIDPYQDEANLKLLKILVSSDSTGAANSHYQAYKETLKNQLDSEPSEEIQAFIENVA